MLSESSTSFRNFIQSLTFSSQVITVRGTSFEPAELSGGSAGSEPLPVSDLPIDMSQFIGQELSKSDRPELTAAKVIWFCSYPITKENW